MSLDKAIKILEYHQQWRLGNEDIMKYKPKDITEALDVVLKTVKELKESSNK